MGVQSGYMRIQCKINRLIIRKTSTTITVIIKRNHISAFNDFCRIIYKSLDTVVYLSSRYERNMTLSE